MTQDSLSVSLINLYEQVPLGYNVIPISVVEQCFWMCNLGSFAATYELSHDFGVHTTTKLYKSRLNITPVGKYTFKLSFEWNTG